jgi:hypothetical protein
VFNNKHPPRMNPLRMTCAQFVSQSQQLQLYRSEARLIPAVQSDQETGRAGVMTAGIGLAAAARPALTSMHDASCMAGGGATGRRAIRIPKYDMCVRPYAAYRTTVRRPSTLVRTTAATTCTTIRAAAAGRDRRRSRTACPRSELARCWLLPPMAAHMRHHNSAEGPTRGRRGAERRGDHH